MSATGRDAARAARARRQRGAVTWLLLLLVALVAAGAWNHHRNVEREAQVPRPHASLSDADLEALLDAYRGELEALRRRSAGEAPRAPAREKGLLGDAVAEFERVQRGARRERDLRGAIREREAAVEQLEAEQARRAGEADRVRLFLRRLLTIR